MPSQVIDEFILLLKSYRIGKVTGDKWAGGFPPEAFQKGGIRYEAAKRTKSDIYRDALPLLNSGRIMLPKNDRLFNQLVSLERHVARGGHDVIDHPSGQHDDLCQRCHGRCGARGRRRRLQLRPARARRLPWDDEGDYETNQEARDRQYRNELAARIFAAHGGRASHDETYRRASMPKRKRYEDDDDDDVLRALKDGDRMQFR